MIQRFYIPACRELQRIESITRSPIYSGLGEAVSGVETIRAFRVGGFFTKMAYRLMEKNADAFVTQRLAALWLAIRLRLIGSVIVSAPVFGDSRQRERRFGRLDSRVRFRRHQVHGTRYEHGERIRDENERRRARGGVFRQGPRARTTPNRASPSAFSWPTKGKLEVDDLSLRYRPGLPLVLKNLTFTVNPGEKVGVCGRTGSGKSSMFVALFTSSKTRPRDGGLRQLDIRTISLRDLRSKMAMIPQDPFMFAGTIRRSLDPFDEHRDDTVWEVLDKVGFDRRWRRTPKASRRR